MHHTFDLGMALMEEFSRQEELARAAEEKEKEEEKKRDRKVGIILKRYRLFTGRNKKIDCRQSQIWWS